jgi:hypothetical protein
MKFGIKPVGETRNPAISIALFTVNDCREAQKLIYDRFRFSCSRRQYGCAARFPCAAPFIGLRLERNVALQFKEAADFPQGGGDRQSFLHAASQNGAGSLLKQKVDGRAA